jgi:two-component system nitrate/nitrite response regulator NarL
MISIMLVDDHPVLRRGIIQLIELEDDCRVVCETSTGEQAIVDALQPEPDIILLDLNLKGLNGIETLSALKQAGIQSKIVMYTVSDNEADVIQAIRGGVDGYVLKDSEPEELMACIQRVANGELVISEPLAPILAKALRPQPAHECIMNSLTNREREIWRYISQGNSNKVIARKLDIAETTVKVHVKNLLRKISLKTRIEAALFAVEHGLFSDH